jgi:thiamine-monophosphate kinase
MRAPRRPVGQTHTEDDLLARIRRALGPPPRSSSGLALAVGDDAAILRPRPGYETVLTCDWFLEGAHFLLDRHPADSIGWKCLARAMSDLAAMGARPRCFLLSLAVPAARAGNWLDRFLSGLGSAARRLGCPAAGGDTTRSDLVAINMTVVGECRRGRAVKRSGARAGDAIFVSGRLGEAELGLRLARAAKGRVDARDARLRKHLYPEPRIALGAWLASKRLATAMMDLSDGLSSDLPRLCQASGVGARIAARRIPRPRLSGLAAQKYDGLSLALDGGDDYELLFTVSRQKISQIPRRIGRTSLTAIGQVVADKGVVIDAGGQQAISLANRGWDPFRRSFPHSIPMLSRGSGIP